MKTLNRILGVAAATALCMVSARAELLIQRESGATRTVVVQTVQPPGVSGISGSAPAAAPAPEPQTVLRHIGTPGKIAILKGAGRQVPLATALRDIVPQGWAGYITDDRVKSLRTVDWYGLERPWTDVLEHFLIRYDLTATVDWNKREISLGTAPNFVAR